jgi:hypothetical protein
MLSLLVQSICLADATPTGPPGQDLDGAPWFEAECSVSSACNAEFKVSWCAHLTCPHDQHLHTIALDTRKAYRRLSRKNYAYLPDKQSCRSNNLQTTGSVLESVSWQEGLGLPN